MPTSSPVDPQVVIKVLVARKGRADRRATLDAVQTACGEIVASGAAGVSLASIVRQLDARGILKGRAQYNAQLRDYRSLVSAWLLVAGLPPRVGADRRVSEQVRAKLTGFTDTATWEWIEEVLADDAAMQLHIDQFVDLLRGLAPKVRMRPPRKRACVRRNQQKI